MSVPRFSKLNRLHPGDKVAILSPSFAAPGVWPHIFELGLKRLREDFGLLPISYPSTSKVGASKEERSEDLIAAFLDPEIKGVISTLGGDDQITYVKDLPDAPFRDNPKPYFGYSDNTHIANHLWLNGVPSFYGGALFTQFAQTPEMDAMTETYLRQALFEKEFARIAPGTRFNDEGVSWEDPDCFTKLKTYEQNPGWKWSGEGDAEGITWGGCLESLDEILRHGGRMPSLKQFEEVVFISETSEEIPTREYVRRVFRAFGERGMLSRIQAVLIGRPKAWEFDNQLPIEKKEEYRNQQEATILETVRQYNSTIPVVQNLDFGHTNPQICFPYGAHIKIESKVQSIEVQF